MRAALIMAVVVALGGCANREVTVDGKAMGLNRAFCLGLCSMTDAYGVDGRLDVDEDKEPDQ